MRRIAYRKPRSIYTFSLLGSIARGCIGFAMILPFIWYVFIDGSPGMPLGKCAAIILLLIGLPLLMIGIVGIFGARGGHSTLESDVSRIRHAVETQVMNDLMKGGRK